MTLPVTNLQWAKFSSNPPPFLRATKPRGRKRQGVKYEAAGHKHLAELFENQYKASQWIYFRDDHGTRWCQPDGIIEFADRVVIVEFKYSHTADAWFQLRLLYQPVVAAILHKRVKIVEVVKWFDCAVETPEPVKLVEDLRGEWDGMFGVHIWKP